MSNSVLLDKSKALALDVIRLCNDVKTYKRESILTNQLVRSGTSVKKRKQAFCTIEMTLDCTT